MLPVCMPETIVMIAACSLFVAVSFRNFVLFTFLTDSLLTELLMSD